MAWHKVCNFEDSEGGDGLAGAKGNNPGGAHQYKGGNPRFTHLMCFVKGNPKMSAEVYSVGDWQAKT